MMSPIIVGHIFLFLFCRCCCFMLLMICEKLVMIWLIACQSWGFFGICCVTCIGVGEFWFGESCL